MKLNILFAVAFSIFSVFAGAAGSGPEKFAQLGTALATPSETRLASGAPGPRYWQQRADYVIDVALDDERQKIVGSETITYHNDSPHSLHYIWLQLDQNRFRPDSDDVLTKSAPNFDKLPFRTMANLLKRREFNGGVDIVSLRTSDGAKLDYTVVKTMMRIELPQPLEAGQQFIFSIEWRHNIVDAVAIRARGGYEYFSEDKNYIYEIAQWYPRVVAYTDYQGWQNKQFLGRGEFTLELGNYEVSITVPADHIVAATGVLSNADDVLSKAQLKRYRKAQSSTELGFIVTPDEASENAKNRSRRSKTWKFKADKVRDFAFASSRKFIWDAQTAPSGSNKVLAMSFYPNEAEPLWSQYSTAAIAHTIDLYSRYTFEYPYPVAISVNGPVGGMEYPMISFNKPRPYGDATYWDERQKSGDKTWERSKYGLISVIIHEVGHNYFPMIVNSDERQWTWMDEGLNTFLQFLAEQAWEEDYPSRRGEPEKMVEYMTSATQVPIMTNSESIHQFGNNAYGKPATALNILRESIMGRELFDYAFREYAQRWMFKRPTPADFFRTMEDASSIDLDWFWRGWFYGSEHVDVALSEVDLYQIDSRDPDVEKAWQRKEKDKLAATVTQQSNQGTEYLVDQEPQLKDFYTDFDEFEVTPYDYAEYEKYLKSLTDRETVLLNSDLNFYAVRFTNLGGLVTPLPLRITYADKKNEELIIPAEIWRSNASEVIKLLITEREITSIELDPYRSTADADTYNNNWPRKPKTSRFQLFKEKESPNPMRRSDKDQWEKPTL
ncbi:MAG: M1 family metallopeptidase [Halieaceae bacterium]|jgi:hypothetical protein|nr:M1 family metallopeptidase [Halieaceae bacterium]